MDENREKTKVNSSEDLLEKANQIGQVGMTSGLSLQESFRSAQILMQEGFLSDAKRELRQILIHDPHFLEAQRLLEEICEQELKNALDGQGLRSTWNTSSLIDSSEDAHELMQKLDQELELGIFKSASSVTLGQLSFFDDPVLLDQYVVSLEKTLLRSQPQDWIDLGIAFLEMELSRVAIRLFLGAQKRIDALDEPAHSSLRLSATALLALAFLQEGKPYEAYSQIQPLLHHMDISMEQKVELYYLVGRSFEDMGKLHMAREFYSQVQKIDPKYRDISDRLQKNRMI